MKNNNLSKIIMIVMSLIIGTGNLQVYAADNVGSSQYTMASDGINYHFSDHVSNYIVGAIEEYQREIDISAFMIPSDSKDAFFSAYWNLIHENPHLFYIDRTSVSYKYGGNVIRQIVLDYVIDPAEIPAYVQRFDSAAALAESLITDEMSDYEKALAIHDYLTLTIEYDADGLRYDTLTPLGRSAYGALVSRKTVCSGYSDAYNYIMNKLGIPCYTITSSGMSHAWNMVTIDGSNYHVDVTFDDPSLSSSNGWINEGDDMIGFSSHRFFLKSDNQMLLEGEHYGWNNMGLSAVNKSFDNAWFSDVESGMFYKNGFWFYIKNNVLYKNTFFGFDEERIFSPKPVAYNIKTSLAQYKDFFLVNEADSVILLDENGNELITAVDIADEYPGAKIYGISVDDSTLTCGIYLGGNSYTVIETDLSQFDTLLVPQKKIISAQLPSLFIASSIENSMKQVNFPAQLGGVSGKFDYEVIDSESILIRFSPDSDDYEIFREIVTPQIVTSPGCITDPHRPTLTEAIDIFRIIAFVPTSRYYSTPVLDMNYDGELSPTDAIMIFRTIAGII